MSIETTSAQVREWIDTPLGRYLFAREQAYIDEAVADVFGYNAFQLGMADYDLLRASRIPLRARLDPHGGAHIRADFCDLPIASNSADLVLLPHVLEFTEHPHQVLREVARILLPEGHAVIACFNPWSLWGFRRAFNTRDGYPWSGRFISVLRLKDWLALLGFEIVAGKMNCYVPPFSGQKWIDRFQFMEKAGDRWWPMAGGVCFLQAVKRVRGMRLIMPKWSDRLAPEKKLATAPKNVCGAREPLAARENVQQ